jgi:hypothetical protein
VGGEIFEIRIPLGKGIAGAVASMGLILESWWRMTRNERAA